MSRKTLVAAPFLPVLLFLTSCVIPIAIPVPVREDPAHYSAKLEPPARYNHPYNGQVVERVVPEAEVRSLCMSMGADLGGVACSWQSNGTCLFYRTTNRRPFRLSVGTKSRIATKQEDGSWKKPLKRAQRRPPDAIEVFA
jgi:hypothetical protein